MEARELAKAAKKKAQGEREKLPCTQLCTLCRAGTHWRSQCPMAGNPQAATESRRKKRKERRKESKAAKKAADKDAVMTNINAEASLAESTSNPKSRPSSQKVIYLRPRHQNRSQWERKPRNSQPQ